MYTIQNTPSKDLSFKDFIIHTRPNRPLLYLAVIAFVTQFSIFKYLYPFASYIHGDSFSYLNAADRNLSINTYLIGYSKFLRLLSVFAKPDYILVALQYLLIQCSVLFLLFTIFYFYKPGKTIQIILICFMIFNPLFLHLANLVSSDGLFLSLSCVWFSTLIWIIQKPSRKNIIWHAVVLFMAFTVRYNALIYPIISGLAFALSSLPLKRKVTGIGLGLIMCGLFVGFTMYQYKKLTGYWQYSPFSGWQLANNAMYMYKHIDSVDRKPVPHKFQALDSMIKTFLNKNRRNKKTVDQFSEASTVYMWSPGMPLMNYRDSLFKKNKDTTAGELKKWASMGPFYKEYGTYLIKKYPLQYILYFATYNARKYYAPPVEFLEEYNSGKSYVNPQAAKWFGYNSTKVKPRMGNRTVWVLDFYPILSGIINLIMFFGLLYYIILKGWQYDTAFNKTIIMGGAVWLVNAAFTIFASSAALRFQSFPVLLTTTFAALLVDWMAQLMKKMKSEVSMQKNTSAHINAHTTKDQAFA